jgi:hypothetical protein
MIKILIIAIVLAGCTAGRIASETKYKVTLDASPSYVAGGDGKGYIVSWQWRQIEGSKAIIENPNSAKTITIVSTGDFAFEVCTVDNLNKSDTGILKIKVK